MNSIKNYAMPEGIVTKAQELGERALSLCDNQIDFIKMSRLKMNILDLSYNWDYAINSLNSFSTRHILIKAAKMNEEETEIHGILWVFGMLLSETERIDRLVRAIREAEYLENRGAIDENLSKLNNTLSKLELFAEWNIEMIVSRGIEMYRYGSNNRDKGEDE